MAEIAPESDPRVIDYAVRLLLDGELIAFPTDTVYGLGARASGIEAIRKLFAAKGRPPSKALPLLVSDTSMAAAVAEVTPIAQKLMSAFWPGALSIVMHKLPNYHSVALADSDTVALRMPDYGLVRSIIQGIREPMTGTSANKSGMRPPLAASEVAFQLGGMIALVIDGGRLHGGVESTVIDTTAEGGPKILREGAVSRAEIEARLGSPVA